MVNRLLLLQQVPEFVIARLEAHSNMHPNIVSQSRWEL